MSRAKSKSARNSRFISRSRPASPIEELALVAIRGKRPPTLRSGVLVFAAAMDVPCCFNTLTPSAGVPLIQTHRPAALFCPTPPVLPPSSTSCSAGSKGFPRLVAGARGGDKDDADVGGALSAATLLMFRNMAALLYRGVPRAWASPAGSSSRVPDPPDADEEESAAAASEGGEEEGVVSEEKAEELEWLEEEAMAGAREGREPGDYDRRAHLFDESSRVFRALKQREEGHRHRRVEGS